MKINNTTDKTIEEIQAMPLVGKIRNNWRERNVDLYLSNEDGMLYMIGTTFNNSLQVISHEQIGMNEKIALDYWKYGNKIYTRD